MHATSFLTALLLGASTAAAAAVEARAPAIFTDITLYEDVGRNNASGVSRTFSISTGGSCCKCSVPQMNGKTNADS